MLYSRKLNSKIKHVHERCSRVIYSDKKSSYKNLLEKYNSDPINHKNIQALAFEMLKVKRKLCPEMTNDLFMEGTNNHYNMRNRPDFLTPQVNNVLRGTGSISYLVPEIWDIVSEEFKHKKSLNSFKKSIKI